jgi:hypothetical protein
MKYELEPDNQNCADETLLDDLRSVASRLGKTTLTGDEYNAEGRFHCATIRRRFGSWNTGLQKAGLDVAERIGVPDAELLDDVKRVALLLGSAVLTRENYDSLGNFAHSSARLEAEIPRESPRQIYLPRVWKVASYQLRHSTPPRPRQTLERRRRNYIR